MKCNFSKLIYLISAYAKPAADEKGMIFYKRKINIFSVLFEIASYS